jgi:hypothetical protein
MPVTARYTPIAPGDTDEMLAFDFSPILSANETVIGGALTVATNTHLPATSMALTVNYVIVSGTSLVASVTAAVNGRGDHIVTFTAATSLRPSLSRSALIFVGPTS